MGRVRHGVAHLGLRQCLDARSDVADLARAKPLNGSETRLEHPHLIDGILAPRLHEADVLPRPQRPVHHADIADHAAVVVIYGVKDKRLKRRGAIALYHLL